MDDLLELLNRKPTNGERLLAELGELGFAQTKLPDYLKTATGGLFFVAGVTLDHLELTLSLTPDASGKRFGVALSSRPWAEEYHMYTNGWLNGRVQVVEFVRDYLSGLPLKPVCRE